ncbi:MAG: excinuclease ABC subunit A, partial [Clostridia bacterium]|nr:excinuclease ABC subunit A [Clostridia bacterium]
MTELSGGELQRIKLSKVLGENKKKGCLYILDEPTSGLSWHDILKLKKVLSTIIDSGNTIIAVEHNIDFIMSSADYIIDFGRESGNRGGMIADQGYIDEIIFNNKASICLNKDL